jgi:hypothetical protein
LVSALLLGRAKLLLEPVSGLGAQRAGEVVDPSGRRRGDRERGEQRRREETEQAEDDRDALRR